MLLLLFSACLTLATAVKTQKRAELPKISFEDNFDKLDLSKWKHDITLSGGGNWEFQAYWNNRSNSYVKDGVLYLKPTYLSDWIGENNVRGGYRLDFWGGNDADRCTGNMFYGCERTSGAGGNFLNPILSAKLTSKDSFRMKYGRLEIRAKLPKGDWLWPAIWMLPYHSMYGNWPASGEIDIMESRGNLNYPASAEGGPESFGSTLHWGVDFYSNKYPTTHKIYTHGSGTLADDFHVYGLYWDQNVLYTYIDNDSNRVLYVDTSKESFWTKGAFTSNYHNPWQNQNINAPFDQEFYLVLNLAVGGTSGYFPQGVAGKPWSDTSPNAVNEFYNAKGAWGPTWKDEDAALKIDYIRAYKL